MGFFDKKIKCSYCNKSVKEEYAINVGICPHCSKRLVLTPSEDTLANNPSTNSYSAKTSSYNVNSNPKDCHHSDGSSHSVNNYTTTTSNTTVSHTSNKSNNNRHTKIVFIVITVYIIANFILPIIFAFISMLLRS